MLKETGYQEKFAMLADWLVDILEVVKKDLRNEHLKIDREFCRRYFLGKAPTQVTAQEMAPAYAKDIREGNVGLGEFIASRWLLKNTDMYGFFEERLAQISPDFDTLDTLTDERSVPLMEEALASFGATRTYLFSVLNSVVFPVQILDRLKELALAERHARAELEEGRLAEGTRKRHERELAAMTDRFEKKLAGMQKKYLRDVEALKKQVGALQRKLNDG